MKSCFLIGAVVLAILSFSQGVESLTCYKCSYYKVPILGNMEGEECKDPFNKITGLVNVGTEECSGTCSKTVTKVSDTVNTVSRGCSSVCVNVGNDNFGTFCCNSDRCNSATSARVSWYLALFCGSLATVLLMLTRR